MSLAERNLYAALYTRPAVRLGGYMARYSLPGELVAYLNYGGATASAKDALAEGMLALAVERGDLMPGQPVVEAAGGTFAAALAVAARRSGHPVRLVVQGNVEPGRVNQLEALGAAVTTTNYIYGRAGAMQKAGEIAETEGAYFVNYFCNDDNPEFHRRVTGPAVFRAMDEEVDVLVAGVGTGGTITGVAEYLDAWAGKVHTVAVQPQECQCLTGGFVGRHGIPGIGAGFVPEVYNPYIVDEVLSVATQSARDAAAELLETDAIPATPSCGAVLCAAKEILSRGPARVVCLFNGMQVYD